MKDRKWVPHGQEVDPRKDRKWVAEGQKGGPGWTGSVSQDGQKVDLSMERKYIQ